jgi:GNAT superfamily N-acetyltransferase
MKIPMDCTIRTATVQDAGRISHLVCALAEEFILNEFGDEARTHFLGEHTAEKVRERLAGDYRFFVAESGPALAGVAGLRGASHLYHLFVAKTHQRQGLARRLWLTALRACAEAGHAGVITVNSSRYAIPVYERFGFTRKGPPEERNGLVHHPMEFRPS